jgi:hypothetical protein
MAAELFIALRTVTIDITRIQDMLSVRNQGRNHRMDAGENRSSAYS